MSLAEDTGTQAPHVTLPCPACGRWNRIAARRMTDGPKCGVCAAPLNLSQPIALTDATFDRVIRETSLPILVDFYADWCGPCSMMAPAVDELARTIRRPCARREARHGRVAEGRVALPASVASRRSIVFRHGREERRQSGVDAAGGAEGDGAVGAVGEWGVGVRGDDNGNGLGMPTRPEAVRLHSRLTDSALRYSCAGSGSIVSGFTGTCTSSRYGDVISDHAHAREGIHEREVARSPTAPR